MGFVAQMIDNGFVFQRPELGVHQVGNTKGSIFVPPFIATCAAWRIFEPWLSRIVNFPEEVVDQAVKAIPPVWLEGEEEPLEVLLARLLKRRARVPDLIEDSRRGRVNPFPNWR